MTATASIPTDAELVEAICTSPIGATALCGLASEFGGPPVHVDPLASAPGPSAVAAMADAVSVMGEEDLVVHLAAFATYCGPFWDDDHRAARVDAAANLAPLAEALVASHRRTLTAPVDLRHQWAGFEPPKDSMPIELIARHARQLFADLTETYECGEFPISSWRTHDPVPEAAVRDVLAGDDSFLRPDTSLWRFPITQEPVVHEIVMPGDWMALLGPEPVRDHPFRRLDPEHHPWVTDDGYVGQSHAPWDCSLLAVDDGGLATIRAADGRILRGVRGMVMPDWTAVAAAVDAVHITWAGVLTTEARLVEWRDGWLTTCRHWGSAPTTRWFRDVFGPAERLPLPPTSGSWYGPRITDAERLEYDRAVLRTLFGPDSAVARG